MKTLDKPSNGRLSNKSTRPIEGLREQALALLRSEIAFIPNREFSTVDPDDEDVTPIARLRHAASGSARVPVDLPAHLARLVEGELLTGDEERDCFRRMNLLKFHANRLRSRIDPDAPNAAALAKIVRLLDEARAIRDHLIQSNTRLVMSIASKHVTSQVTFDDLLSEGISTLMYTIEKFDYDRGFRFSTYAYRAISRQMLHSIKRRRKQIGQLGHSDMSVVEMLPDESRSEASEHEEETQRDLLRRFVARLDRRERFILRSRHALGSHRRRRTCRELADKLGISKERVRQLEKRAIAKVQEMAAAEAGPSEK